jgi:diguanylate cyclase (GGDEF)-like protein/PAS domain S-box-containing protein
MTLSSLKGEIASVLSLRTVFLLAVALGVLIPSALIGTLTFSLQRDSLSAQAETAEKRLLDMVALGMQEPLWNLSRQEGQPLLQSVMDDSRVISLRVTDTQSNTVFLSALRAERRQGGVSIVQKPVVYRGEEIGRVTIVFDTEHLNRALRQDLEQRLLILLTQLALSLALIMGILHSRFLRPLRELTHQATQLAELKLDLHFHWQRSDEIGRLGRHLEWTRSELKHLFDELRAKTAALEADIVRRREIEGALRRSENKYRELFWSNLDGIVISTLDGQVLDANPAFLNMMGYSLEQLKLLNFWSLVSQESQALEHANLDDKVLRFGYCDEFEATYLNRLGSAVQVSVKTAALRDAGGQINAVWRMVHDISERLLSEQRMQLASKVYESTAEGIMITDANLLIRSVNRAFCNIFGYSQAQVLGQKPNMLSSGRQDAAFYRQMWQQLGSQGQWQGEVWNRRKNGEVFPEWLAINTVKNAAGEITHYVAIFSDLTERRAADERIHYLAHFDVLTGLPNRGHMQDRAALAVQNAAHDNRHLALLLVDLDRFKTINESLGHAAGDTLLQISAERIQAALGPGQTVARQGGDEFIVLLPDIGDASDALRIAEQIIQDFVPQVNLANHAISITPSIGISVYPQDGCDFDRLLRSADAAMHHAKSFGCNSYRFYTADLNTRTQDMLAIESLLQLALSRDQFVLYYQPQVDMASGRIVGAEALIRWNHPDLGLLGPSHFIEIAEHRGMIVQIGNWVIRQACQQLATWYGVGLPRITLAVNLSALQFRQPELLHEIEQALQANALPGSALDIEVTESVIMEDVDMTSQTLDAFKRMGVQLSIDDFGTGYSSLSYLKRFKADKLKIDQSFVRDIPQDTDDSAIARAIINMAQTLNMKVVAEGVETLAQWQFMRQEGCDQIQGYLLSRPLPAHEFAMLLVKGALQPLPAAD